MKYLKYFEEVDFDPMVTDPPELKMSKEKLSTYKKYLSDYNSKKKLLDKVYLTAKTDSDLKKGVENIIGSKDVQSKEDSNPFLVEYLNISSLKRKMDTLQKELVTDKLSKDDFTQQLRLSSDVNNKTTMEAKIKDITNRISTKTLNISSLSKDVNENEKKLKDKMSKIENEMKEYIKNISTNII